MEYIEKRVRKVFWLYMANEIMRLIVWGSFILGYMGVDIDGGAAKKLRLMVFLYLFCSPAVICLPLTVAARVLDPSVTQEMSGYRKCVGESSLFMMLRAIILFAVAADFNSDGYKLWGSVCTGFAFLALFTLIYGIASLGQMSRALRDTGRRGTVRNDEVQCMTDDENNGGNISRGGI